MATLTRAHPGKFEPVSLSGGLDRLKTGLGSTVSRRELLAGSLAGTAAMLAMGPARRLGQSARQASRSALPASASSAATTAIVALSALAVEHFSALVGEPFQALAGSDQATLVLRDVTVPEQKGDARPRELRPEGFSLLFDLADGSLAESGIMSVQHRSSGRHDIFLHRVGLEDGSAAHYEAVFN